MVTSNRRVEPASTHHCYCVYASRKDGHTYAHSHEEILRRYASQLVMQEEMPPMNWPQMGRYMYTAKLDTYDEVIAFIEMVHKKA